MAFLRAGAGHDAMVAVAGQVRHPVFIVGCGRSGTTILGSSLSRHPRIVYLNEPRRLWFAAYPEADIWTEKAAERGGRMVLTEADVDPAKSRVLHGLFHQVMVNNGGGLLVEKNPINNFRLSFIREIFPDARFVHIVRNGRAVARSIARKAGSAAGGWFGRDGYKWKQLVQCAEAQPETAGLAAICSSDYEKGLLEWRLSVEAVRRFLCRIPSAASCELSYDELVTSPVDTVNRVLRFIGMTEHAEVTGFVATSIFHRDEDMRTSKLSEKELRIGGDLLVSMLKPGCVR
ncbi:MAG TPA: sulfotransferase [Gammaproteobacteria bacterium]|nr:sulfotransferase [Gammaproteobacteria bacterium]